MGKYSFITQEELRSLLYYQGAVEKIQLNSSELRAASRNTNFPASLSVSRSRIPVADFQSADCPWSVGLSLWSVSQSLASEFFKVVNLVEAGLAVGVALIVVGIVSASIAVTVIAGIVPGVVVFSGVVVIAAVVPAVVGEIVKIVYLVCYSLIAQLVGGMAVLVGDSHSQYRISEI